MTKQIANIEVERVEIGPSVFSARLPDAAEVAQQFLTQALNYSVDRMGWKQAEPLAEAVRRNASALAFFRYSLAEQTARYIGSLDENIKSIHYYDDDGVSEDVGDQPGTSTCQIHLVAWVSRRTDALQSLAAALNRALATACMNTFDCFPTIHILDLQVADDEDVRQRVGYGALLTSIHNAPLEIWQR